MALAALRARGKWTPPAEPRTNPQVRVFLTARRSVGHELARCPPTESAMTIPRTVTDVLKKHVTFELEGIDRM
jgi:hypothetical protein